MLLYNFENLHSGKVALQGKFNARTSNRDAFIANNIFNNYILSELSTFKIRKKNIAFVRQHGKLSE